MANEKVMSERILKVTESILEDYKNGRDIAVVQIDELLDVCEADAVAAALAHAPLGAVIRHEDALAQLGKDAYAGVGD